MTVDLTTLPLFLLAVYLMALTGFGLRVAGLPASVAEQSALALGTGLLVGLWRAPLAWRIRLSAACLVGVGLRLALTALGASAGWPEIVGVVGACLTLAGVSAIPRPVLDGDDQPESSASVAEVRPVRSL